MVKPMLGRLFLVGVVLLKTLSRREPQNALSKKCLDRAPVEKGTWENKVFRDVPCGVEMHLQDSDNFLWRLLLCVKKEAKEGRSVGKNKGIPTQELGLDTDGLLYMKYLRKPLVVSLKNIVIFFRKEEREGEERKSRKEVRRDRGKEEGSVY